MAVGDQQKKTEAGAGRRRQAKVVRELLAKIEQKLSQTDAKATLGV
jgi:hypothetical protein